jgi:hypothetical protein
VVDRAAWEQRLREISGLFKQYPDVFYDTVELQASNETDYFVSSEGARVATPSHVARLVIVAAPAPPTAWTSSASRPSRPTPSPTCPTRRP